MGKAAGESARALHAFGCRIARSTWLRYTGTKRVESVVRNSRSSTLFEGKAMAKVLAKQMVAKQLVVCVDNEDYPASLEKRKIYVALSDTAAEKKGLLRIIDESGEDYLYPKTFF